jgi:two-component system NarL family response regulator
LRSAASAPDTHARQAVSALGRRERQVLSLLAEGKHSAEIAGELGISVGTVDVHRRNIMRKLNLHTIAELTKFAVRKGLTSL